MKLKLKHKFDKSSNSDPLVLHVEWGGGERGNGEKIIAQKYIAKVAIGQTIDVQDQLGYAILARYGDCFEIAADAPVKHTKEAVIAETK